MLSARGASNLVLQPRWPAASCHADPMHDVAGQVEPSHPARAPAAQLDWRWSIPGRRVVGARCYRCTLLQVRASTGTFLGLDCPPLLHSILESDSRWRNLRSPH